MNIDERIANKTSDELSQILSELEQERNGYEDSNDCIEEEIFRLSREILNVRTEIKKLEDSLRKGRKLVRDKRLDYRIAERLFWRVKQNRI